MASPSLMILYVELHQLWMTHCPAKIWHPLWLPLQTLTVAAAVDWVLDLPVVLGVLLPAVLQRARAFLSEFSWHNLHLLISVHKSLIGISDAEQPCKIIDVRFCTISDDR